jgi:hypothetical protein
MGNVAAGFQSAEGSSKASAVRRLEQKVAASGGRFTCDERQICVVEDRNGVRFRVHVTELHTFDGVPYYSATTMLM